MKVIEPGYAYELKNMDPTTMRSEKSMLFFVKKEADEKGNYRTKYDGTTNEEVLLALIHRLKHQQAAMPCRQNAIAITKMEEAMMWMEHRTRERKQRGVEATTQP